MITEKVREFDAALPDGGVLIGIDPGTKTVGLATCDAGWHFATAGKTHPRGKFGALRDVIAATVRERRVAGFVVGLPRNMDGSEGSRAQASRALARNLVEAFGLPVLLWDERLSTVGAERALIEQDFSRARRATRIDSHAAAIILQGAIDALGSGGFAFDEDG
ncbi:Holliday junction resolvase RuvX [Croceicoccus sp. YJ47]|uniref:Holliday junction resolvase RuvX n=1 Tax=Croceicoccus sp. YJ47 TaxID=2798724 RepID=UPI0019243567|nr:Holliday junction resolvase RuvX [Croceicoccus sp. YJ47]QQN74551.1 Holliday junction resolvase RuvX [Croceicoccus sp. YJ47]